MWLYIIGGILLIVVLIVLYLVYRGYNKIKPKPIVGIPCPPLSHQMLGHPDKMMHPLKHELRLEVTEYARAPVHQLVLMNHASVFINDSSEAAHLIDTISSKGRIYGAFRYDANTPDILACDEEAFLIRKNAFGKSIENLKIKQENLITKDLLELLLKHSESGEILDLKATYAYFAFDCICESAFEYKLNAVNGGSIEGKKLYQSLCTLFDAVAGTGLYPNPDARKVPAEELQSAKDDWRNFLLKIVKYIQSEAEQYRIKNGRLDVENKFGHALVQLSLDNPAFTENVMMCEVHQLLKHGHECIAGMLQWITLVLHKVKQLRSKLEKAIVAHTPSASNPYPLYLECIIKEVLRRYPVAGNMTVRTPSAEKVSIAEIFESPAGTPIHMPIFTLQNSTRDWFQPKQFIPERWLDDHSSYTHTSTASSTSMDNNTTMPAPGTLGEIIKAKELGYPKCPFMSSKLNNTLLKFNNTTNQITESDNDLIYNGAGFKKDSLSYFPFSAGQRSCLGKSFALTIMRRFLYDIASNYHLDPSESFWEEDAGVSINATIVPLNKKAYNVKVHRIISLVNLVNNEKGALVINKNEVVQDEGWAEDDDDDDDRK